MKELTIIFSKAKGFSLITWLIRLFQRTPFSHVAIALKIHSLDEEIIYEADWHGVTCKTREEWEKNNEIVYEKTFRYTKKEYKDLQKFCIGQLGKPYGFQNLIAILTKRNTVDDKDSSFICSELAYKALKNKFPELFKNQDYITPKDLFAYILKHH